MFQYPNCRPGNNSPSVNKQGDVLQNDKYCMCLTGTAVWFLELRWISDKVNLNNALLWIASTSVRSQKPKGFIRSPHCLTSPAIVLYRTFIHPEWWTHALVRCLLLTQKHSTAIPSMVSHNTNNTWSEQSKHSSLEKQGIRARQQELYYGTFSRKVCSVVHHSSWKWFKGELKQRALSCP